MSLRKYGVGFLYQYWWGFYANLEGTHQNRPKPGVPFGNAGIISRTLQESCRGGQLFEGQQGIVFCLMSAWKIPAALEVRSG